MKNMVLLWSTIYETHYMKNKVLLWSTSVEKEIVALPFLFIYFFLFLFLFFFFGLSFLFFFLAFLTSFFSLGNALIMMIITLLLITTYELQLETRTRYDSIWMPPAVYRDGAMNQEWHVWKIMHGGFATNTMSTKRSCNGNMTKVKHVMMMMMMMMVEVAWQYISEWLWKCHDR